MDFDALGVEALCPGFCGRLPLNASELIATTSTGRVEDHWTPCGPCPFGSKNVDGYRCTPCRQSLRHYDYLYLIFNALTPLFINGVFIKFYASRSSTRWKQRHRLPTVWCVVQLACASLEATLALLAAIFVFPPFGHLDVYSCRRSRLSEFYSTLYHPAINATHTLRCAYEVVYPLYSLPFASYGFALLFLILLRSPLYILARSLANRSLPAGPFYAGLWTLPIAAIVHSFLGGILYFTFANITVFAALLSNAVHLSLESVVAADKHSSNYTTRGRLGVLDLAKHLVKNTEALMLAFVHTLLVGFGLFAIYFDPVPTDWASWIVFGICLPLPVAFYILTVRLTAPPQPVTRSRRQR